MLKKWKEKKSKFSIKGKKKFIVLAILLIIIIGVVITMKMNGSKKETGMPVSTSQVEQMDVEQVVSLKGVVEGSESAEVTSPMNYKIVSIFVQEGDHVKKGQTIAVLDGDKLQSEYNTAKDQYDAAVYDLADKIKEEQKAYENDVRTLENSEKKYLNNKTLYEQGAIAGEEFDKLEAEYKRDKAAVDAYEVSGGRVVASQAQNKTVEIRREELQQKQSDLDEVNIKSPIDGTITRVNAKLGRYASDTENKEAMFVIEDLSNLKMNVKIGEYDISKIKLGQKVTISAEVMGEESVQGTVSRISPSGEKKEGNATTEMVIPVQIDVIQSNSNLIPGVTAKAIIQIDKKEQVMAVSTDAILQNPEDDSNVVFIVTKENKLKKIPVTLGLEGDFHLEVISSELKIGDKVVLSPNFEMDDGMLVMENQGMPMQ